MRQTRLGCSRLRRRMYPPSNRGYHLPTPPENAFDNPNADKLPFLPGS
jgi:hypothetical protein